MVGAAQFTPAEEAAWKQLCGTVRPGGGYRVVVTDFRPGYPEDRRLPTQVARVSVSYFGDFELMAARVLARFTGEHVIIQDDNSSRSMPDIKIVYRQREPGYAEVTQDLDPTYAATASAIKKRAYRMEAPSIGRIWWVTLSREARLRTLDRTLVPSLDALGSTGDVFEYVVHNQRLGEHSNPVVQQLAADGVVQLASRPVASNEVGQIHIGAEGTGGYADLDWKIFGNYLSDFLADLQRKDVREKLAATRAVERHVFVGLSYTTPWPVFHALDVRYTELPTEPPQLPAEITHLWIWSQPHGRCLAWYPDRGWFEPRYHWATD